MKAKTLLSEVRGRSLKVSSSSMNDSSTLSLPLSSPRSSRSLSPIPRSSPISSLIRSSSDREKGDGKGRQTISISICTQLTPSQVLLIRKSWKHVNTKALNGVLRRCFQRLETSCPCVASSFASASNSLSTCPNQIRTLSDHARYLSRLIQRIIESDEGIEEEVRSVGGAHHNLDGIGIKEFEQFGEIFIDVIVKLDGIQQSKETSRAWRQLVCSIVDHLRDGFDINMRQTRRKSSFGVHSEYFNGLECRRNSTPGGNRKGSLNADDAHPRKLSDFS